MGCTNYAYIHVGMISFQNIQDVTIFWTGNLEIAPRKFEVQVFIFYAKFLELNIDRDFAGRKVGLGCDCILYKIFLNGY